MLRRLSAQPIFQMFEEFFVVELINWFRASEKSSFSLSVLFVVGSRKRNVSHDSSEGQWVLVAT